jgi:RHS repeat-associated protein
VEDLATWLFEANSFAPAAKLTAQGAYSVVCDHLGTPLELYDQRGTKTWLAQLDSYGAVREGKGRPQDCPFRYQGQYEDVETGLYYNRFRYYDPEAGQYISQDPLGLAGGSSLYNYVTNPTSWIDPYGLAGENPFDFLDFALQQRGFQVGDPIPPFNNQLKHSWSDVSTRYTYEVRVKAAASQYGRTGNEFRVARTSPAPPPPAQGTGMEYLDINGNWHHQSTLKPGNPQIYNPQAVVDTHMEIPGNRTVGSC